MPDLQFKSARTMFANVNNQGNRVRVVICTITFCSIYDVLFAASTKSENFEQRKTVLAWASHSTVQVSGELE